MYEIQANFVLIPLLRYIAEVLPLVSKQLQTRYGMIETVLTQERGGAGGAQPPLNCLTHLNAALHCKDQAAQKWLNRSSGVQRERSLP